MRLTTERLGDTRDRGHLVMNRQGTIVHRARDTSIRTRKGVTKVSPKCHSPCPTIVTNSVPKLNRHGLDSASQKVN